MEHIYIPDQQRHEVKGASTASPGMALFALGGDNTQFRFPRFSDITEVPPARGYQRIVGGASSSIQAPTVVGTVHQVTFGPLAEAPDVVIGSDGTVTFNSAGEYLALMYCHVSRNGIGSTDATVHLRLTLNGVQVGGTTSLTLAAASARNYISFTLPIEASGGDELRVELQRDSAGSNAGGLYPLSPTDNAWEASPSAAITLYKFSGVPE